MVDVRWLLVRHALFGGAHGRVAGRYRDSGYGSSARGSETPLPALSNWDKRKDGCFYLERLAVIALVYVCFLLA